MDENEFSKIKGKVRDKMDKIINETEEAFFDEVNNEYDVGKIIRLRQFLIYHLLEGYCTWSDNFDCLPTYVKVGAIGNLHINLEGKE